ncbi:hypothetical protein C0V97_08130 [Asaia sp. W19]|uniref:DUF2141 domain-containing protein n=1 Tax=unclassified Asaia TaxID=2685023 RepID=UPI000F8F71DE|nr:DUF2141 domain-containing protein [Asaia sp. W19]RUT26022.1 hypothetical protein C0V97_08130 [Asaia sp. W19]
MIPDFARQRRHSVGLGALATMLFGAAWLAPAHAATVSAEISNIPDNTGTIRVALCTEDEFLKPSCAFHAETASTTPRITVVFSDVPAGTYAIQAYQDRNGDAKLNRTFIGIPKEPIGFSRDPKLSYGPPSFEECALRFTDAGGTVALKLITH